jgi:hypothetical protein
MALKSDRPDVGAIYFRRDGALQEVYRDDEPMGSSRCDQNSFQIGKRAGLHPHSLAYAEKRMRTTLKSRADDGLDRFNLSGGHRRRLTPKPYNVFHIGRGEDRKAIRPT